MNKKGYSLIITVFILIIFIVVSVPATILITKGASQRQQNLQQGANLLENDLHLQSLLYYEYQGKTLATWIRLTYTEEEKNETTYELLLQGIQQYYAGRNYFYMFRIMRQGDFADYITIPDTINYPFNTVVTKQRYQRDLAAKEGAEQALPGKLVEYFKQAYFTITP